MTRARTQTQRNRRGVSMAGLWFWLFLRDCLRRPSVRRWRKCKWVERRASRTPRCTHSSPGWLRRSVHELFLRSIGHHCRFSLDVLFWSFKGVWNSSTASLLLINYYTGLVSCSFTFFFGFFTHITLCIATAAQRMCLQLYCSNSTDYQ